MGGSWSLALFSSSMTDVKTSLVSKMLVIDAVLEQLGWMGRGGGVMVGGEVGAVAGLGS